MNLIKSLATIGGIVSIGISNAASINVTNLPGATGTPIVFFDNSGNALTEGTVSIFQGTSPVSFADVTGLGAPLQVIDIDIATGSSPGGGLFASTFDLPNLDGSISGDVFLLISNTAQDQFAAIDIAEEFGIDTTTSQASTFTTLLEPSLVTLSDSASGVADTDLASIGITVPTPTFQLRLAAVPEPSSALLLGLSGLGLLARRKR